MGKFFLLKKIWRQYQAYQRTFRAMRGLLRQHAAEGWDVHSATTFAPPQCLKTPEALRATDVNDLRKAPDPVGSDNDCHVEQFLCDGALHVAAWDSLNTPPEALRSCRQDVVQLPASRQDTLRQRDAI